MRDDVVKLEIGPYHVEYFVHPGLLLQHSEYFKGVSNGNWKEAAEKAICLDDVDCKTCKQMRGTSRVCTYILDSRDLS